MPGPHRLALLIVFGVSRLLYYWAGIRFDARPLDKFFQIYDPVLLRTRLGETLFYAHTQPPGFNLMLGWILKLFPEHFAAVAHVIYLILGMVILVALFELMRAMGISSNLSAAAAGLFIVTPGLVLFENLLTYEYPILAMLAVAALCWYRLFERPRTWLAFLLLSLLAMLVLFRSLFHLFYLVLAIAIVIAAFRQHRKALVMAAALPFLLASSVYVKNWVQYGQFTSSTWMGFNIYTITTHQLTPAEMERFISEGRISPVERIDTLGGIADYIPYIAPERPRGVPVLDQEFDSTGRPNFNNLTFFQLHRLYLADGKFLLLHYPVVYLRSILKAWFAYFLPPTDFPYFNEARAHIRGFDRWVNLLLFGQFKEADNRKDLRAMESEGASIFSLALYTGMFLLIGLPALFVFGCYVLWKGVRAHSWTTPGNALLAFLLFHIAMITALVNLLSSFENNRYRLPIDGFFLVLAALAADAVIRTWRGRSTSFIRSGNGHADPGLAGRQLRGNP